MPLRDHFRPPLDNEMSWESFHAAWPTVMVMALNQKLPAQYIAEPRVHLGAYIEVDVGTSEKEKSALRAVAPTISNGAGGGGERMDEGEGGVATAVWAPPQPTLSVTTNLPDQAEYEVRVYDTKRHRLLVAAVEIVSPANKDRPENRRVFVAKCAALLQQGVAVTIVDLVTTRQFNLYADLMELIGQADPSLAPEPPPLYAVTFRWQRGLEVGRFETWAHSLALGNPLPTLPLWLADQLAVPLELDSTYEETCRILRIP